MKTICALVIGLMLAQSPPVSAPALSELQQAQLKAALLQVEVAGMKRAQAERDLDQAVDALQRMLATLYISGYELDTATGRYRPVPRKGAEGGQR
jgi:hypothetical protein